MIGRLDGMRGRVTAQVVGLRGRVSTRLREDWPALTILALLLLAGLVLRAWLAYAWRPAFLGYPDSGTYLLIAANGPFFADSVRTMDYALLLRAVHALVPHLSAVMLLQHALGVASALLLFGAVRRIVRSSWAALLPAAVVLLGGTEIFLEHSILTESVFIFLQALAIYAVVRSFDSVAPWWPLVAGLAVGIAATVRAVGLFLVPLVVLVPLAVPGRSWSRRALTAGAALAGALAIVLSYSGAQDSETGHFGLTRGGGWNLYGRVAPFTDCSQFTPPVGTKILCERTPPSKREGPEFYVFGGSPAVHAFGGPFTSTQKNNDRLGTFARTVMLNQPLDYLDAIAKDMRRYIWPERYFSAGWGLSPVGLVEQNLLLPVARTLTPYWQTSGYSIHKAAVSTLADYERTTRIDGALVVVLALLSLAAPFVAPRGRMRLGAVFLTLLTLGALIVPIASLYYDARFAVPAFGVLAASAAVGAHALALRLRPFAARVPRLRARSSRR